MLPLYNVLVSYLRLFCPELAPGERELSESDARHAFGSRRLRPGDIVELFDGRGRHARGVLLTDGGEHFRGGENRRRRPGGTFTVRVGPVYETAPPTRTLTLVVAGCKGPRLQWLVEKCTELGVTRLVFADFARSVVHVGAGHLERLHRKAVEACKQCGRLWLPEMVRAGRVREAVASLGTGRLLVAHTGDRAVSAGRWFSENAGRAATAVIGPEGGLTGQEVAALLAAGGQRISLGAHVLRVETAAVAAAAAWAAAG